MANTRSVFNLSDDHNMPICLRDRPRGSNVLRDGSAGGHPRKRRLSPLAKPIVSFSPTSDGTQPSTGRRSCHDLHSYPKAGGSESACSGRPRPRQVYRRSPVGRFVTVINFQGKIRPPFRTLTSAIWYVIDSTREAKRTQPRYSKAHLTRDPRQDLFAVSADFDGAAVSQLGIDSASAQFAAFLFDGQGRLIRRWSVVPTQSELAEALAAAEPRS